MTTRKVNRTNRLLKAVSFFIGGLAGLTAPAQALNGDTFLLECDTCSTMYDFESLALQTGLANVQPGLYLITSNTHARTAYAYVSGQPLTWCDYATSDCWYYLNGAHVRLVTETGATATSVADLERIDEQVFGINRKNRLPPIDLSPTYQSSIINSDDAEVGPGITEALMAKGINPYHPSVAIGSKVMVTFPDGTKALFKIKDKSSDMWEWADKAWDANGNPINRDGTPVGNPNSSGLVSGFSEVAGIGWSTADNSNGSDYRFELASLSNCMFVTTVIWNGSSRSLAVMAPC